MSDAFLDILTTDRNLDLVAARQYDGGGDLILDELATLAEFVDAAPLPPAPFQEGRSPSTHARKGGWALAVTLALMATSSGFAAAVGDNPLTALHSVAKQVWRFGPHGHHGIPGWLDGSPPIFKTGGASTPGRVVQPAGAGSGREDGDSATFPPGGSVSDHGRVGVPRSVVVRTPASGPGTGSNPRSGVGSGAPPVSQPPGRTENDGPGSGSPDGPRNVQPPLGVSHNAPGGLPRIPRDGRNHDTSQLPGNAGGNTAHPLYDPARPRANGHGANGHGANGHGANALPPDPGATPGNSNDTATDEAPSRLPAVETSVQSDPVASTGAEPSDVDRTEAVAASIP